MANRLARLVHYKAHTRHPFSARQRQRMLAACGTFATEYGLAFTP